MKRFMIAAMMFGTLTAAAQNTWETNQPSTTAQQQKKESVNPDLKYLAGAVPVVDGKVTWKTTIKAPGKSAQQIYDLIGSRLSAMTKESNQFEQSRIMMADTTTHQIVANFQEWLVFKSTALVLDRTRMMYHIIADCKDGSADITMTRIYYLYDEERQPQTYVAEEWITDKYGLNKKQDKLSRVTGKFRSKTIDRKDNIFETLTTLLQK